MILLPGERGKRAGDDRQPRVPGDGAGAEARFGEGIIGDGRRGAQADSHLRVDARDALRACRPEARGGSRSLPQTTGGFRCPACRIRKASSACRCWCAASSSACCASRAKCRIASTKTTRPRSSCSAATWLSRSRTCCGESGLKPPSSNRRPSARPATCRQDRNPCVHARNRFTTPATSCIMVDGEYLDSQSAGAHPVETAAAARRAGTHRVHQSRAAARQSP